MRNHSIFALSMATFALAAVAVAQSAPSGQKTLAATLGLYAFPSQGQSPAVQSTDESQCYAWAVQTTGIDPFELQKQAQAQTQQIQGQASQQAAAAQQQAAARSQGAGLRGAAVGAATGALIGEVGSGNASRGAAVGAASGAVVARSRARRGQRAAEQQAAATTQAADAQVQQVQAATAQQMDGFKKAFSVCLEAKHYLVKF